MEFFGYGEQDMILCELCPNQAVDIAHIEHRGMGGSRMRDLIENLVAMCRHHHDRFDGRQGPGLDRAAVIRKHLSFIKHHGKKSG